MAMLRKLGEIIGGFVFSLAFGFLIVFVALANFTQYDTLHPIVTNLIEGQLTGNVTQNQLDFLYRNLTEQCKTSSTAIVPLDTNNQAELKCDDVKNSDSSGITHLIAKGLFDQIYYKKYECSFVECVREVVFANISDAKENQKFSILVSSKANEFFTSNQIFLIITIILGVVLIIISVRVWYNILKVIGITLLLVGITYLFIPTIKTQVAKMTEGQNILTILDTLFAPITKMLQISLILGIVFTTIGYVTAYLMDKPEKKKN